MPTHEELTTWTAIDRDQLIQVWRELAGDVAGDEEQHPAFQGQQITIRDAGYVFQTWIIEALRLSDAEVEPPFRIPLNPGVDERTRHELDGLLVSDWNGFLIESKFERVDFSPIARLHLLAEGCPTGTMGLFFAAKGFTGAALDAAHILRPMRVLLFDREDIECVLQSETLNLVRAVRLKWKASIMYGRPNVALKGL